MGNTYYLYASGTNSGPSLKLNSAAVTTDLYPGWSAIGAEKSSSGYEVAWKNTSSGQFVVWATDNSGNFTQNFGVMTASDATLQSHETLFQQDLNGDGHIGSQVTTTIESFGSTSLAQVGNAYYLYASGTNSGPSLKLNNAAVTTDLYPGWSAIGAEKTSSGYEVAWKNASSGQFVLWGTDNSGNFIQNFGVMTASDSTLQSHETLFQQDLNADGRIGPAAATTVTLQPGAEGQDLWITNFYTYNDDYGVNNEQLKVGGWGDVYDALVKFDLSNSHVAHVSSATLQLYNLADGGNPTGMSIEQLQTAWDETYGWYNYGGTRPSTLGAATATPPGLSFSHITNVAAPTGEGWVSIDVTAAVNDWLAHPNANFGLLIQPLTHDNNNVNDFVSSDVTGANAPFHPKLVLHPDVLI